MAEWCEPAPAMLPHRPQWLKNKPSHFPRLIQAQLPKEPMACGNWSSVSGCPISWCRQTSQAQSRLPGRSQQREERHRELTRVGRRVDTRQRGSGAPGWESVCSSKRRMEFAVPSCISQVSQNQSLIIFPSSKTGI